MELKLNSLILLLVFVILLVVIFRTIKESLKFDLIPSVILSVSISLLAVIGLKNHLKEILPLYAALAICILFAPLLSFLFKPNNTPEDKFHKKPEKNLHYDINEKRKFKTDNERNEDN